MSGQADSGCTKVTAGSVDSTGSDLHFPIFLYTLLVHLNRSYYLILYIRYSAITYLTLFHNEYITIRKPYIIDTDEVIRNQSPYSHNYT